MTPDRKEPHPDENDHGVLESTSSIDTGLVGIVDGATAAVQIPLPPLSDDDLEDDDVVLDDDVTLLAPVADAPPPAGADEDDAAGDVPDEDHAAGDVPDEDDAAGDVPDEDDARDAELDGEETESVSVEAVEMPAETAEEIVEEIVAETTDIAGAEEVVAPPPARPGAARAVERHPRVRPRTSEITLASRRLDDFDAGRESPDLLTADRLLDPAHAVRPEPEGTWRHLLYTLSGRRINLGDSARARARKELDRRIAAPLPGEARFVPVLSRKGGVGKTTVTTLLGMALADTRDDRVIAVDANPDRGTLADRVGVPSGLTVRDLVRSHREVHGFNDLSQIVGRDQTRLDVLASDADPHVSEAFSDADYREVAELAAHFYSIVLTDTGTGIVHSVMEATLAQADQIVVVAGLSVDEARLASETLTWLETNGFADRVREAVVVLNTARPGAALVRADELQTHFATRVRAVVRMPYDPHIAAGSTLSFRDLQPETREAARTLAAVVVEGLRALAAA